ncbi:MAG: hypothetical protein ACKOXM_05155 [Agromyces sp.]
MATVCGALSALGARIVLIDQTSQASRLLGRGERIDDIERRMRFRPESVQRQDGLVCVSAERIVAMIPVSARACALDAGS